ncbi:MAG: SDR family NAD(P)-dependent oxidoreductase [Pseudomonadota bacterium]
MTKTILITGATDGIGLLTAKMLAGAGHKLLLHGRSADKLSAAMAEVGGTATPFQADLSSLSETRTLAERVGQEVDKLDITINNAGVYKTAQPILQIGQDVRFVVNTLAPYALTQALLPLVPKDGRIINLSSAAQAPVDIAALRGGTRLEDMAAYAQSKRAITLWSAALAAAHANGPTFLSVNPGSLLATKMVREGFGVAGNDLRIGADILCRLALDAEFSNHSGEYWDNDSGRFAPVDLSQAHEVTTEVERLTAAP